jgi:hypothetical protein
VNPVASLTSRLTRPVDAASLGAFRLAFGVVLAVEVVRFFAGGWIAEFYLDPPFHFTYSGFHWVRPLPAVPMYAFFALLLASALGVALGVAYRACATFFAIGFTYVFLLEKARYLNHFYLVALLAFLLAALPAHRAYALGASRRPDTVSAWMLGLVRAQVGLVYFYAGVAKLNEDWLGHAQPLIEWLGRRADHPVLGSLFASEATAWVMSWGGCLLDLAAWPLLAWRRTRPFMFACLVAFHLMNAATFGIGIFPWLMIPATTLWFAPDWPRRFAGRRRAAAAPPVPISALAPTTRRSEGVGLALATVWLAIQVLVPLRHFLYEGNVHWTEEGHAFSWHMKLRGKDASAIFTVTDPETGQSWLVDPRDELTDWQTRKMSARPDMILEYARHLGRTTSAAGKPRRRVTVYAEASLNSRPRQLIVDPDVDLASVEPTLGHATWIVPLADRREATDG